MAEKNDKLEQRMELRIYAETKAQLQHISSTLPFSPPISEVARSFIEKGIAEWSNSGFKKVAGDDVPLVSRLNLYYQIRNLDVSRPGFIEPTLSKDMWHPSELRAIDVVTQAYRKQMLWFFGLNEESLKRINPGLANDDVRLLMNKSPDTEAINDLQEVCDLVSMFEEMRKALERPQNSRTWEAAAYNDQVSEDVKALCRIKNIPLEIDGFPETQRQKAEMLAMLRWVNEGKAERGIWVPSSLSKSDMTYCYNIMLERYREMTEGMANLDNLRLLSIIKNLPDMT
ncbi:hypothetical protein ABEH32_22155 [Pantoea agglomerans]|uniref:hypothetical protein n=1 Tax=Enterobacter agglomerans TaxID=549 RepID=UPI0016544ECA|nr:hypothetical protein [Pantoea agglomerans]